MMILKIKQKGLTINIPGIATFRTPAEVEITNSQLHLAIFSLKNNGVDDFEIFSKEEKKIQKKSESHKKEKKNITNLEERFNKLEEMIERLTGKNKSNEKIPEEQITNKLILLEELSKKILEKESVREIVYTSTDKKEGIPIIEELDEDTFIPTIDISEMKLKGSSSEVIDVLDDVNEAAKALSQLKK